MDQDTSKLITQLLHKWNDGDGKALDELIPVVEAELRRQARIFLKRERAGHTLETMALVNEAFLHLLDQPHEIRWENRAHFFGIVGRIMRRILVDHARKRLTSKRSGRKVGLEEVKLHAELPGLDWADILSLHESLDRLAALDERQARIVELKFFAGLSHEAIGEVVGVSPVTVKREWRMARAWLLSELEDGARR